MVYVEEKEIKGKKYYYVTKNTRIGDKWEKTRTYVGTKHPSQAELEELDMLSVPPKYLTEEQVKVLARIKNEYSIYLSNLSEQDLQKFEAANLTHFAYNTSAIEGSSMSLPETGYLLEENRTPTGKDLWEIYSAINTKTSMQYIKNMKTITDATIKELHKTVMQSLLEKELGEYRTVFMRIRGAKHIPPAPSEVPKLMAKLIEWYREQRSKMNVFELACLFHVKFECIHPFRDGNGRVGRLLMNFILQKKGFPILDIPVNRRIEYYNVLGVGNTFKPFVGFAYDVFVKDCKSMGWC